MSIPETGATAVSATSTPKARRRGFSVFGVRVLAYQIILFVGFLALWEYAIRAQWLPVYLYGQPSGIWRELVKGVQSGALVHDTWITAQETIIGFIIGSVTGSIAGLGLWLSPTTAAILRPLMVALNGLPKIALAPLIVVWFGVGMESKVAIAAIITFIVAMLTSFAGSQEVDSDYIRMMKSLGASRLQTFRMVVVPGTVPWIASAFRLNIGFAMIGAVVGEYISAEAGLGHHVYYSGTLYNLNAVWGGIFALMILALILDAMVGWVERRMKWR
ncbi:MAG: ABC transporter permease [Nitrospira sp.]|nr:ABC transporter permease [Nitrospira sp.]MBX3513170.1 ABC transporter permease [Xanthobacteraceae bacterium]MCW5675426.1 ABC transporter permease [Xanthobacteraceae bacterium]